LTERARTAGIEVLTLSPTLGDFNEALRLLGVDHLRCALRRQLAPADRRRDTTMATDRDDTDFEPPHTSSATDHVLSELQLYGYRPFHDEPDPRPLSQANAVSGAVADIFDALIP
jgi:hypothetical protein